MKLELKHLAGYLPYELKGIFTIYNTEQTVRSLSVIYINRELEYRHFKPILRPLSDLTKEIEVNGDIFIPLDIISSHLEYELNYNSEENEFSTKQINRLFIMEIPYLAIDCMLEWHFDIYGLIENGLAIDMNTLDK